MTEERKKVNCITINTDASYHPVHKAAGYAFYIVCDLFKIQKGGMFKQTPKTPEECEIMCIGNAIATLLAQRELPEARWLIINSDCKNAMEVIRCQKNKLGKDVCGLWNKLIHRLGSKRNKFRHVKSHNGTPDARSWVNDWCDKEAKRWMRVAVEKNKKLELEEAL